MIMVGLACFLIGLAMGRKFGAISFALVVISGLGLLSTTKKVRLRTLIFCVIFGTTFGWWRGGTYLNKILPYQDLYGKDVVMKVVATTDGTYTDSGQLGFDVNHVQFLEPLEQNLPGMLKIEAMGVPAIYRGDNLEVRGSIYPAGGARQGSVKFANVRVLGHSTSLVETFRRKFIAGMQTALPEPHASFGLGLLIGQRATLPESLKDQLSIVGLTHIIAVSGYNLTIIIRFVTRRIGKRSKFQILILSLVLISLFLLVTGFSASIVRAALVSCLGLGAWYYGRQFRPLLILLLSGALTAGWYPVYIWSDIGWYLSFLAFFGVLIVAPMITKLIWRKRPPRGLMQVVVESGCAQLLTAPLIVYIFKQTSLVALPSNMLIVPLVPLAMLLSLISGLAGMIVAPFASWLAWPARVLMSYMFEIINILSRVPKALIELSMPLWAMIILYLAICLLCLRLWQKTSPKYAKITDEKLAS